MKSLGSGVIQPATLTILSGMATIIAATLALGLICQDQSGVLVAQVSESFRSRTTMTSPESGLISVISDTPPTVSAAPPQLPGIRVISFEQVMNNFDPVQEFTNLHSELERMAGHTTAESRHREIRIDLFSSPGESAASLINRACSFLRGRDVRFTQTGVKLEIQTWAASPTQAAWVDAVSEAAKLREELSREFSQADSPRFSLTSSASLWPHADRPRPLVTIVLRIPLPHQRDF